MFPLTWITSDGIVVSLNVIYNELDFNDYLGQSNRELTTLHVGVTLREYSSTYSSDIRNPLMVLNPWKLVPSKKHIFKENTNIIFLFTEMKETNVLLSRSRLGPF